MSHPTQPSKEPTLLTAADVVSDSVADENTQNDNDKHKNSLAWGLGIFFAFGGLTCGNPLMALVWIAMGAVLIPPTRKKLKK